MSNVIGNGISFRGMYHDEFQYSFLLAAGITKADEGKAVAIDASAVNTVKLAGDGDRIIGRLEVVEIRIQEGINIGTASIMGGLDFPPKVGYVPVAGDPLIGGGGGTVRKAIGTDAFGGFSPWTFLGEVSASGNPVAVKL
jgi:hypothetical protein